MNKKDKEELRKKREVHETGHVVVAPTVASDMVASIEAHAAVTQKNFLDQQVAMASEQEAERAVLKRALRVLKPIRQAIMSRLASTERWKSGQGDVQIDWFGYKAVVLIDRVRSIGHGARGEHAESGDFSGTKLLLMETGKLAHGSVTGSWSRIQGEDNHREMSLQPIRTREAIRAFGLLEILHGIEGIVVKQAGRAEAASRSRQRAEMLLDVVAGVQKAEPKRIKLLERREEKVWELVRAVAAEIDSFGGSPEDWDDEGKDLLEAIDGFRDAEAALAAADQRAKERRTR